MADGDFTDLEAAASSSNAAPILFGKLRGTTATPQETEVLAQAGDFPFMEKAGVLAGGFLRWGQRL